MSKVGMHVRGPSLESEQGFDLPIAIIRWPGRSGYWRDKTLNHIVWEQSKQVGSGEGRLLLR